MQILRMVEAARPIGELLLNGGKTFAGGLIRPKRKKEPNCLFITQ